MGVFTWTLNRMAGGAKTGVVTLEANTPTGLSNEIAKYTQKGYALQGGITTGSQYGGNTHKYLFWYK